MTTTLSIIACVLPFLVLAALAGIAWLVWKIYQRQAWYLRVSVPWFNNIGKKIGLDDADTIATPPVADF